MRPSSTACSIRPDTASTWRGSGSTPRGTATPTACTWTTTARSGPIATGSSGRSTPTSRSIGSSSSSSPATCCPNPTLDQIVATGFNRCHVSTSEGGSIEEEVYVRNIVDQVDTNGTVFLGLSTGCARCHDHKYDPIRAKDYYQLFAFFNNIDGPAMDGNSAKWEPIVAGADRRAARGDPVDRRRDRGAPASRSRPRPPGRWPPARPGPGRAAADLAVTSGRADFVWVDDALPAGRSAAGGPALEVRRQARSPGPQRAAVAVNKARGLEQRVLRQRRRRSWSSARGTRSSPMSTSTRRIRPAR